MELDLEYIEGQTPIDDDEKDDLLIKTISNRQELNEFEQFNIEKAVEWTLKHTFNQDMILNEKFILGVHQKMFNEVWRWAGIIRKTNKNLGVDKSQILIALKCLLDDCRYWIENKTFNEDEIVLRFKHRLVSIHIFPNGNGRHARLYADIMISNIFNKPVFSWGGSNITNKGQTREEYLKAIRIADEGYLIPLIKFARS